MGAWTRPREQPMGCGGCIWRCAVYIWASPHSPNIARPASPVRWAFPLSAAANARTDAHTPTRTHVRYSLHRTALLLLLPATCGLRPAASSPPMPPAPTANVGLPHARFEPPLPVFVPSSCFIERPAAPPTPTPTPPPPPHPTSHHQHRLVTSKHHPPIVNYYTAPTINT